MTAFSADPTNRQIRILQRWFSTAAFIAGSATFNMPEDLNEVREHEDPLRTDNGHTDRVLLMGSL